MDEVLKLFNSVWSDCEVFESIADFLKARYPEDEKFYRHKLTDSISAYSVETALKHDIQPLYCNYHGRLRVVDDPVCQHHLETFDPWCWERCETEWPIKRLRPALSAAYKQHKECKPLKVQFPAAGGAPRSLWGE